MADANTDINVPKCLWVLEGLVNTGFKAWRVTGLQSCSATTNKAEHSAHRDLPGDARFQELDVFRGSEDHSYYDASRLLTI